MSNLCILIFRQPNRWLAALAHTIQRVLQEYLVFTSHILGFSG